MFSANFTEFKIHASQSNYYPLENSSEENSQFSYLSIQRIQEGYRLTLVCKYSLNNSNKIFKNSLPFLIINDNLLSIDLKKESGATNHEKLYHFCMTAHEIDNIGFEFIQQITQMFDADSAILFQIQCGIFISNYSKTNDSSFLKKAFQIALFADSHGNATLLENLKEDCRYIYKISSEYIDALCRANSSYDLQNQMQLSEAGENIQRSRSPSFFSQEKMQTQSLIDHSLLCGRKRGLENAQLPETKQLKTGNECENAQFPETGEIVSTQATINPVNLGYF